MARVKNPKSRKKDRAPRIAGGSPETKPALLEAASAPKSAIGEIVEQLNEARQSVMLALADARILESAFSLRASIDMGDARARKDAGLTLHLMTLYRDEIVGAVSALLSMAALSPRLKLRASGPTVVYLTPHQPGREKLWIALKAVARSFAAHARALPRQQHLEVQVLLRLHGGTGQGTAPVSILVRSAFDDLMGAVASRTAPLAKAGTTSPHLNVFTKYVADAYDTAESLRAEATLAASSPSPVSVSLGANNRKADIEYAEKTCALAGLSKDITERFLRALNEKAELGPALSARITERREPQLKYKTVADELRAVHERSFRKSQPNPDTASGQAFFLMRIEEAVCRLLVSDKDERLVAMSILTALQERYANRPTLWFRLAQAHARVAIEAAPDSFDAGQAAAHSGRAYRKSAEVLAAMEGMTKQNRLLRLSDIEAQYLRENTARLHSFVLWRMADRINKSASGPNYSALDLIIKSYWIVDEALQTAGTGVVRWKLLNNLVSYGAHLIETMEALGMQRTQRNMPSREDLKQHIASLISDKASADRANLQIWDSVGHAFSRMNEWVEAKAAAQKFEEFREAMLAAESGPRSGYEAQALERAHNRALQILAHPS